MKCNCAACVDIRQALALEAKVAAEAAPAEPAGPEDTAPANPYERDPDADLLPAIIAEMHRRPQVGIRPRPAARPRNVEER